MLPDITGLTFYPKAHQYILAEGSINLQLPSVTQIMRFLLNEFYNQIDYATLQKAADRGTRIHEATELLDECGWTPREEDTAGYIAAYERWKADFQPQIVATEWRGYHRAMFYAGTVDRIIKLPDQKTNGLVLVDIKNTSTYHPLLVDVQLAGYAQMIESWPDMKIESAWGLQLKPDGSYKFERTQSLLSMKSYFNMCYALHNAVQKEKEA